LNVIGFCQTTWVGACHGSFFFKLNVFFFWCDPFFLWKGKLRVLLIESPLSLVTVIPRDACVIGCLADVLPKAPLGGKNVPCPRLWSWTNGPPLFIVNPIFFTLFSQESGYPPSVCFFFLFPVIDFPKDLHPKKCWFMGKKPFPLLLLNFFPPKTHSLPLPFDGVFFLPQIWG